MQEAQNSVVTVTDKDGIITAVISGSFDAANEDVLMAELIFTVSEVFDTEINYFSPYLPENNIDSVYTYGFWHGTDKSGNTSFINLASPTEYVFKYGFIYGTVKTIRENGFHPNPENYMSIILYDAEGNTVDGYPLAIENEKSDSTVDFEIKVSTGEYGIALFKNGYVTKKSAESLFTAYRQQASENSLLYPEILSRIIPVCAATELLTLMTS